jgi:hypothetical protein
MEGHRPIARPALRTSADTKQADGYLCTCGRSGDNDFVTHLLEVAESERMDIPARYAHR